MCVQGQHELLALIIVSKRVVGDRFFHCFVVNGGGSLCFCDDIMVLSLWSVHDMPFMEAES